MKIATLFSAGLIAAAFVMPGAASAQHHDRVVTRTTTVHTSRTGYRPHVRRVCRVAYRHHQRIRTCRMVRR